MSEPSWLEGAKRTVEQFTGQRPQNTVVHLVENGRRKIPAVETGEGLQHYIERNLLGQYNVETHNATFPGKGVAIHASENLELTGYEGFDVTELLMKKRGIDPRFLEVISPQALEDLGKEVVTPQELEQLRKEKEEQAKKKN
jgi:hypothetical protein